jgi:hypothetical protein
MNIFARSVYPACASWLNLHLLAAVARAIRIVMVIQVMAWKLSCASTKTTAVTAVPRARTVCHACMEIARFVKTMVTVEGMHSAWTVSAFPILQAAVDRRLTLIAQAI